MTENSKFYRIALVPEKNIPEDGWDVAIERIFLRVKQPTLEEAAEMAVDSMRRRDLHMKYGYGYLCEDNEEAVNDDG